MKYDFFRRKTDMLGEFFKKNNGFLHKRMIYWKIGVIMI